MLDQLRELLMAEPFRPFALRLRDGRSILVDLGPDVDGIIHRGACGLRDESGDFYWFGRIIPIADIAAIEPLTWS